MLKRAADKAAAPITSASTAFHWSLSQSLCGTGFPAGQGPLVNRSSDRLLVRVRIGPLSPQVEQLSALVSQDAGVDTDGTFALSIERFGRDGKLVEAGVFGVGDTRAVNDRIEPGPVDGGCTHRAGFAG